MHFSHRELFFRNIAQTSPFPVGLEISKAEGVYIYDEAGKPYLDFISGIAVSNVGHQHPKVKSAIIEQLNKYAHIMVYGETIQHPQTEYAQLLIQHLPDNLNCIYFVNSGSEAIEGAIKLAKAYTGRNEIIAFEKAYHGSTQGALSIMGDEFLKTRFRPLVPGSKIIRWNVHEDLMNITQQTAAVFVEPIKAEAGVWLPENNFLKKLRQRCDETGALLVFDEIQTGFGRTGKLFAFEHYGVIPDVLVIGKAMGGGLPIGAFIADKKHMEVLAHHPLGHLTTFGGNAVCVASALASLKVIIEENLVENALRMEDDLKNNLQHAAIRALRVKGALAAVQLESEEKVMTTIEKCLQKGLIVDWFLFASHCIRIAPPLIIRKEEIERGIDLLLECLT
ncbi:MAG: aspartate aminotransferase family protein [Bacteroidia bacterium]|nr:aspartate aminotransferase family protein [Bacteroidia bacterium]